MKYVPKKGRYNILRLSLGVVIPAVLVFGLWSAVNLNVFAADNIINVTTTADEDADSGTGCSLYEAIIAANTDAAYGGCSAGSATDTDVISLPAGTYARDAISGPNLIASNPNMLDLDNVSVVGSGVDTTIIDGYGFNFIGDDATSFESLTHLMSSSYNYPNYLVVQGSNKSFLNVDVRNETMSPAYVTFATTDGQTLQNINFNHFNIFADLNATIPATIVDCSGAGVCDDVSFNNSVLQSNYSTGISLADVNNVSLTNSTFTTLNSSGITVALGDNAIVSNSNIGFGNPSFSVGENSSITSLVVTNGFCGSNTVTIKAGTTINGLEQRNGGCANTLQFSGLGSAGAIRNVEHIYSSSPGSSYVDIPTSLFDGFDVSNAASTTFSNEHAGSTIQNISITSASTVFGSSTMQPDLLSNVSVTGGTALDFQINRDNAILNNILLRFTGSGTAYPSAVITGEAVIIDDIRVIKDVDDAGSAQGLLNIVSPGSSITNLKMLNSSLDYDNAGDFSLEYFTITGPSHMEAFTADGVTSAVIRRGYINDARGGMSLNANPSDISTALIEDMQFSNLGVGFSTNAGALIATDIDEVTVRRITAYRVVQDFGAPINIYNGALQNISNATIVDSSGGVYAESNAYSASPMNVNINNITVYNNEDSSDHFTNDLKASLVGHSSSGRTLNLNVKNSAFGGVSLYTPCIATDDILLLPDALGDPVYVSALNSYATESSCVGMGFTGLSDFMMDTILSNNSSVGTAIGYNGEFGVLQTLALESDSELLLSGDADTCEATDARGFTRDLAKGCDVGAFQLNLLVESGGETPPSGTTNPPTNGGNNAGQSGTTRTSNTTSGANVATNNEETSEQVTTEDKTSVESPAPRNTSVADEETDGNTDNGSLNAVFITIGSVFGLGILIWIIRLFTRS